MLHFAFIWGFLLLPVPIIFYFLKSDNKIEAQAALKIPFYSKITQLNAHENNIKNVINVKEIILWSIWCLLVIAFVGPQWLGKPVALPQQGRNIMLAVDISGSMQTPDMTINHQAVNRLTAIKTIASQFIQERQGDRVGLILFGSKAYLQTPLTFDRRTISNMLHDASIGLAGQMTAVGDAIGLSIKRLMHYPTQSRVLILLTDGSNNSGNVSPLSAATMAAKHHIKIYTIGFGSDKMRVSNGFGSQTINPSVELDEPTLQQIAKMTNAQYFRAKDTQSLKQIYQFINQLEPINSDKKIFRPTHALYPWPLTLALLLSIGVIATRLYAIRARLAYPLPFETRLRRSSGRTDKNTISRGSLK